MSFWSEWAADRLGAYRTEMVSEDARKLRERWLATWASSALKRPAVDMSRRFSRVLMDHMDRKLQRMHRRAQRAESEAIRLRRELDVHRAELCMLRKSSEQHEAEIHTVLDERDDMQTALSDIMKIVAPGQEWSNLFGVYDLVASVIGFDARLRQENKNLEDECSFLRRLQRYTYNAADAWMRDSREFRGRAHKMHRRAQRAESEAIRLRRELESRRIRDASVDG